ncbi:unnamed protein product [Penicillium salamii]|uniref:Casein kinase II subunit beta n=1 Tax=Penicillium salamii TaxID=1612424 RepID=A0A9W4JS06_9EURO|nr:unnamed protein product [Penicillium salamii]CAG8098309.1 unnamed protein product [Penicillium salamii]CAG8154300.1 unnamed protein product [Penicillium salamii]CAG8377347.1 unnamed protein product [Penicillium salamii]CAG8388616.1 unnamed protein product [Penicillium salamii]
MSTTQRCRRLNDVDDSAIQPPNTTTGCIRLFLSNRPGSPSIFLFRIHSTSSTDRESLAIQDIMDFISLMCRAIAAFIPLIRWGIMDFIPFICRAIAAFLPLIRWVLMDLLPFICWAIAAFLSLICRRIVDFRPRLRLDTITYTTGRWCVFLFTIMLFCVQMLALYHGQDRPSTVIFYFWGVCWIVMLVAQIRNIIKIVPINVGPNNDSDDEGPRKPDNVATNLHAMAAADLHAFNVHTAKLGLLIMILCIVQFVSSRGNEYFCEIDEDYLTDRFNLTGLNTEVSYYQYALDLVTDVFDLDADDDLREQIEKSARHLYGLVHARYIVTTRGLAKMLEKYKKSDFGKCPRVMCDGHALLPVGQSDLANLTTVKLYCPKCEDIYNPKSSRHASIDGAYFGTSFHSILFQVYPALNPAKSCRRYEPRIYGFRVHAAAALARYQDGERQDLKMRLADVDLPHRFLEDSECDDAFELDEDYAESRIASAQNQAQIGDAASAKMEIGN